MSQDGVRRTALQLLSMPEVGEAKVLDLVPGFAAFDPSFRQQIARDALYEQFSQRQDHDIRALAQDEQIVIPGDLSFRDLPGLSRELQSKLDRLRPASLGDAGRIEGMTPAALALILARVRRKTKAVGQ